jgi:hypothetical protein
VDPLAVAAAVLMACVPWFHAASLMSGLEHPRHAVTLAVCLRVGALLVIVTAWDRLSVRSDGASLPTSSTP